MRIIDFSECGITPEHIKTMLYKHAAYDEVLTINSHMQDSYTDEEKKEIHAILCMYDAADLYKPHPDVKYSDTVLTHLNL